MSSKPKSPVRIDYARARRPDVDVTLHLAIIMALARFLLRDGDYRVSMLERSASTPTPLREYRVSRRNSTVRINDEMPLALAPPRPLLTTTIADEIIRRTRGNPLPSEFDRDVLVTVAGDASLRGAVTISASSWHMHLWTDLDPAEGPWSLFRHQLVLGRE